MKLTVLGSGVAISSAERAASGFVLEFDNTTIAVDLGFGCFKNLQKAGIDCTKVNDLFFTHFEHPDHVNDLTAFLMARKGLVEFGLSQATQINIYGSKGFKDFVQKLFEAYPFFKQLPFKLNVVELPAFGSKKFAKFSLATKPMKHAASSIGYRFKVDNAIVAFSGDTEMNENLVALAKDAGLLVVECSFVKKKSGHLNVEEAAIAAERAGAKALLLTHFYPEADREADLKLLAKNKFKGKIYLGQDLMEVNI